MTDLTGKLISGTYKQLLQINASTTNSGITSSITNVQTGDGTNSALSLGSLTSCALKFATDSNTGIISPGADQLSIVTGGVARLTIDGSGSVTIPGNASITGSLTVTGQFNSDDNLALIVALS